MSDEATSSGAGVEIPKTEGMVPGGRQGELPVRRDDNVGNEMVMSMKDSLGITVTVFIASQLPDNDRLVWDERLDAIRPQESWTGIYYLLTRSISCPDFRRR